jgi:hypothetical protein
MPRGVLPRELVALPDVLETRLLQRRARTRCRGRQRHSGLIPNVTFVITSSQVGSPPGIVEAAGVRFDLILRNGRIVDDKRSATPTGSRAVGSPDRRLRTPRPTASSMSAATSSLRLHRHPLALRLRLLPDQAEFLQHFLAQGITTLVTGNCGCSGPINPPGALMQATRRSLPRDLD